MTQPQLAEKVCVQPMTISRIETGRRSASLELLAHIAEALDLEMHELFRFSDEDKPKARVLERLLWFESRLSMAEIELVMDVGSKVLGYARQAQSR